MTISPLYFQSLEQCLAQNRHYLLTTWMTVLRRLDQAILESLLTQGSNSFGVAGHLQGKGSPSCVMS